MKLTLIYHQWLYDAVAYDLRNRAEEMQGRYKPNLTWWSKDGVYSWWAKRVNFQQQPQIATNMTNLTLGTDSGNLGGGETTVGGRGGTANTTTGMPPFPGDGDNDKDDDNEDMGEGTRDGETGSEEDTATSPVKGSEADAGGQSSYPGNNDPEDVGDMIYQCDDNLGGGPDPLDCEKLSWSGLKPADSIETLQPNIPNFYTQGKQSLPHFIDASSSIEDPISLKVHTQWDAAPQSTKLTN